MPRELKERLAAEVTRAGTSLNDVAVGILAARFAIPFEPSGRKGAAPKGRGDVLLRMPAALKDKLTTRAAERVPGLMHVNLGGYHVRDIEFTAAFDVTTDKVGKDLADAIWARPNDTYKFANVPKTGVEVSRGMTHDGIGKYLAEVVEKAPGDTDDVVRILQETGTDVVVSFLPVGSEEATKWYAEQILNAGCAMVNCMPVFIAKG